MRILPEMWASTLWPFSSSTRNMAFGNGSITVPSRTIASSLGLGSADLRNRCQSRDCDPLEAGRGREDPAQSRGKSLQQPGRAANSARHDLAAEPERAATRSCRRSNTCGQLLLLGLPPIGTPASEQSWTMSERVPSASLLACSLLSEAADSR